MQDAASKPGSLELRYICRHYGVPAKVGAAVEYEGKRGKVTGASGPHVKVKLDGDKHSLPYHPLDLKWLGADAPDQDATKARGTK